MLLQIAGRRVAYDLIGREGADFSFSGLKTAVRQIVKEAPLGDAAKADLAASFQAAVVDVLTDRVSAAMQIFRTQFGSKNDICNFVVAGGVAANGAIRQALDGVCEKEGYRLSMPPVSLCTDNGAMVAWAGLERFALGLTDGLETSPLARWPMEALERTTETELGRRRVPAGQGSA